MPPVRADLLTILTFTNSLHPELRDAARNQPTLQAILSTEEVQARLARLDGAMRLAQESTDALAAAATSPTLKDATALAQHLLGRLRTGWYASGLWSSDAVTAQDAAEVESVEDELFFRLRSIERATRLRAGELPAAEAQLLQALCDTLSSTAL